MNVSAQKIKCLLFIVHIFIIHSVAAQNVIYFTDGTKALGKITDILPNKIKFTDDETDKSETRQNEKLSFVFNSTGSYLTFAKDAPPTPKEKDDFMKQVGDIGDFDIIGDLSGDVVFTKLTKETDNQLTYIDEKTTYKTVPTALVSFLIRRDGTHKVFISNQQAAPLLKLVQQKVNAFIQNGKTIMPSQGSVKNNDLTLTREQKNSFGKMATDKVVDFTNYIKQISSLTIPPSEKNKTINLAESLFKQDAKIQVSNVNVVGVPESYAIRTYLTRLLYNAGRYQKIDIESADINYITKFRPGVDGNYYGTVTYVQKFVGYIDNVPMYQDVTTRKVEVIVKVYHKEVNGQEIKAFDVILGDVSVMQTRKKM